MTSAFGGDFAGKTVLVTGHTGFKGAWLSLWLRELGASVIGYSLPPEDESCLYARLGLDRLMDSRLGDVRDAAALEKMVRDVRPEVVFHLAAEPLVRRSYERPSETFSVNVQGAVNLLEAVRRADSVRVCQIVTSDKCYENNDADRSYREDDRLGGRDPYSASKACVEIAAAAYRSSFLSGRDGSTPRVSVSTVRAGNVIGGGDWACDRLIPDAMRALLAKRPIQVRNPRSTRPWQFVLEPLSGYLALAASQLREPSLHTGGWNFGPPPGDSRTTAEIADMVVRLWGEGRWVSPDAAPDAPHEASVLTLDSGKALQRLGWRTIYDVEGAIARTVDWYKVNGISTASARDYTCRQIEDYVSAAAEAACPWAPAPRPA